MDEIDVELEPLDQSYNNYRAIIDKNLPYKFKYLDKWLLAKSQMLLYECEYPNRNYWVFKKGTIIEANFGVGIGSEMSQYHFAIVLGKNDNAHNNVLTVVPLTSKCKMNLKLDNLIMDTFITKMNHELTKIAKESEHSKNKANNEEKMQKINDVIDYYSGYVKHTYACINLITTISKTRISKPINEFDILGVERCSDEVMRKIDKAVENYLIGKI